jgi:hypothetical protein
MNILKANKYIIFTEGSAKVAKNKSEIMIFLALHSLNILKNIF